MAAIDDAVSKHLKSGGMKTREDFAKKRAKAGHRVCIDIVFNYGDKMNRARPDSLTYDVWVEGVKIDSLDNP
jgi:hypothetical protein